MANGRAAQTWRARPRSIERSAKFGASNRWKVSNSSSMEKWRGALSGDIAGCRPVHSRQRSGAMSNPRTVPGWRGVASRSAPAEEFALHIPRRGISNWRANLFAHEKKKLNRWLLASKKKSNEAAESLLQA